MIPPKFFPILLRELLLEHKITPIQLATYIEASRETVLSWLRASSIPRLSSVFKISKVLGGHQVELIQSSLRWSQARKSDQDPEIGNFSFKQALLQAMENPDLMRGVTDKDLPEFVELCRVAIQQADRFEDEWPLKSIETDASENAVDSIVLLPQPTIIITDQWSEVVNHIARDSEQLYTLNWKKFEDLVAYLLESYGWSVEPMGYTKDGGIDILAVRQVSPDVVFQMMVQCKRFSKSRRVGVEIVREIWSVKWERGFHQAMIATTSSFTRGALETAEKWNLELRDHDSIVGWCQNYGRIIL